ncbi:MAG: magnesium/cobalt transporter CorA [Chloroflexota bacterium]
MSFKEIKYGQVTWINIENPKQTDIDRLAKRFPSHHPLALEDCLSRIERPKIDDYDDHLFVVMQFPKFDRSSRISRPAEVDLFLGRGYLVTVHDGVLLPLNQLFTVCQEDQDLRQKHFDQGAERLFHTVIDQLVDYIFPILSKIDAHISRLGDEIFESNTRSLVREISLVRRDIISLRRIIRPQIAIIANLEQQNRPFIHEDLDEYFGDILDHIFKIRDIVEEDYEMIADLSNTTDSLLSHRINEVMRVLTVMSVIMLPLTLISGIFGMNIPLPFEKNPFAFIGMMGIMVSIFAGMIIFFRYRNWL